MSRSLRSERIPTNGIILYAETGCVPVGYTHLCSVNCKFVRGVATGVDPGTTFGAATHTHSVGHDHSPVTIPTHSHVVTSGGTPNTINADVAGPVTNTIIRSTHTHDVTSTTTPAVTPVTIACAPHTHDSITNEPPFKTLRHIKNTRVSIGLRLKSTPSDSILIWSKAVACIPNGYTRDCRYDCLYVKGSATVGTTGGTATHIHSGTGAHTHGVAIGTHTHTVSTVAPSTAPPLTTAGTVATAIQTTHTHTAAPVSFNCPSTSPVATNPTGCHTHDNISKEPPFKIVTMIKSSTKLRQVGIPAGSVIEWDGTLASIPTGLQLADGTNNTVDLRQKILKFKATCIASTGGTCTHTHSCSSHTHTTQPISHTHPITGTLAPLTSPTATQACAQPSTFVVATHTHPLPATAPVAANCVVFPSVGHTHGATTHLPPGIELAYIEKLK